MAASAKLPVPKGVDGMDNDDVAAAGGKKAGRWGFVQFFFVLAVVLCVLLYAPRVLVLSPYGYSIDIGLFAPTTTSSPSVPLRQRVSGGGNAGGDGGRHGREVVLDNQVDSSCSSMRDHTICCDRSSVHTDVCFMAGDVRTDAASLSLLLFPPPHQHRHDQARNSTSEGLEERAAAHGNCRAELETGAGAAQLPRGPGSIPLPSLANLLRSPSIPDAQQFRHKYQRSRASDNPIDAAARRQDEGKPLSSQYSTSLRLDPPPEEEQGISPHSHALGTEIRRDRGFEPGRRAPASACSTKRATLVPLFLCR